MKTKDFGPIELAGKREELLALKALLEMDGASLELDAEQESPNCIDLRRLVLTADQTSFAACVQRVENLLARMQPAHRRDGAEVFVIR